MSPEEVFERIARLRVKAVPDNDIGAAMGFSASDMREILEDAAYLEIETRLRVEELEAEGEVDTGWDALERQAQKGLMAIAKTQRGQADPDFMLRLGALSNKAERRANIRIKRGQDRAPISANNVRPVVINLTANYVNKLQTGMAQVARGVGQVLEHGVPQAGESTITTQPHSQNNQQHQPPQQILKDINRLPVGDVLELMGVEAQALSETGRSEVKLDSDVLSGDFDLEQYFKE